MSEMITRYFAAAVVITSLLMTWGGMCRAQSTVLIGDQALDGCAGYDSVSLSSFSTVSITNCALNTIVFTDTWIDNAIIVITGSTVLGVTFSGTISASSVTIENTQVGRDTVTGAGVTVQGSITNSTTFIINGSSTLANAASARSGVVTVLGDVSASSTLRLEGVTLSSSVNQGVFAGFVVVAGNVTDWSDLLVNQATFSITVGSLVNATVWVQGSVTNNSLVALNSSALTYSPTTSSTATSVLVVEGQVNSASAVVVAWTQATINALNAAPPPGGALPLDADSVLRVMGPVSDAGTFVQALCVTFTTSRTVAHLFWAESTVDKGAMVNVTNCRLRGSGGNMVTMRVFFLSIAFSSSAVITVNNNTVNGDAQCTANTTLFDAAGLRVVGVTAGISVVANRVTSSALSCDGVIALSGAESYAYVNIARNTIDCGLRVANSSVVIQYASYTRNFASVLVDANNITAGNATVGVTALFTAISVCAVVPTGGSVTVSNNLIAVLKGSTVGVVGIRLFSAGAQPSFTNFGGVSASGNTITLGSATAVSRGIAFLSPYCSSDIDTNTIVMRNVEPGAVGVLMPADATLPSGRCIANGNTVTLSSTTVTSKLTSQLQVGCAIQSVRLPDAPGYSQTVPYVQTVISANVLRVEWQAVTIQNPTQFAVMCIDASSSLTIAMQGNSINATILNTTVFAPVAVAFSGVYPSASSAQSARWDIRGTRAQLSLVSPAAPSMATAVVFTMGFDVTLMQSFLSPLNAVMTSNAVNAVSFLVVNASASGYTASSQCNYLNGVRIDVPTTNGITTITTCTDATPTDLPPVPTQTTVPTPVPSGVPTPAPTAGPMTFAPTPAADLTGSGIPSNIVATTYVVQDPLIVKLTNFNVGTLYITGTIRGASIRIVNCVIGQLIVNGHVDAGTQLLIQDGQFGSTQASGTGAMIFRGQVRSLSAVTSTASLLSSSGAPLVTFEGNITDQASVSFFNIATGFMNFTDPRTLGVNTPMVLFQVPSITQSASFTLSQCAVSGTTGGYLRVVAVTAPLDNAAVTVSGCSVTATVQGPWATVAYLPAITGPSTVTVAGNIITWTAASNDNALDDPVVDMSWINATQSVTVQVNGNILSSTRPTWCVLNVRKFVNANAIFSISGNSLLHLSTTRTIVVASFPTTVNVPLNITVNQNMVAPSPSAVISFVASAVLLSLSTVITSSSVITLQRNALTSYAESCTLFAPTPGPQGACVDGQSTLDLSGNYVNCSFAYPAQAPAPFSTCVVNNGSFFRLSGNTFAAVVTAGPRYTKVVDVLASTLQGSRMEVSYNTVALQTSFPNMVGFYVYVPTVGPDLNIVATDNAVSIAPCGGNTNGILVEYGTPIAGQPAAADFNRPSAVLNCTAGNAPCTAVRLPVFVSDNASVALSLTAAVILQDNSSTPVAASISVVPISNAVSQLASFVLLDSKGFVSLPATDASLGQPVQHRSGVIAIDLPLAVRNITITNVTTYAVLAGLNASIQTPNYWDLPRTPLNAFVGVLITVQTVADLVMSSTTAVGASLSGDHPLPMNTSLVVQAGAATALMGTFASRNNFVYAGRFVEVPTFGFNSSLCDRFNGVWLSAQNLTGAKIWRCPLWPRTRTPTTTRTTSPSQSHTTSLSPNKTATAHTYSYSVTSSISSSVSDTRSKTKVFVITPVPPTLVPVATPAPLLTKAPTTAAPPLTPPPPTSSTAAPPVTATPSTTTVPPTTTTTTAPTTSTAPPTTVATSTTTGTQTSNRTTTRAPPATNVPVTSPETDTTAPNTPSVTDAPPTTNSPPTTTRTPTPATTTAAPQGTGAQLFTFSVRLSGNFWSLVLNTVTSRASLSAAVTSDCANVFNVKTWQITVIDLAVGSLLFTAAVTASGVNATDQNTTRMAAANLESIVSTTSHFPQSQRVYLTSGSSESAIQVLDATLLSTSGVPITTLAPVDLVAASSSSECTSVCIAIIIVAAVIVLVIGVAVYKFYQRRKKRKQAEADADAARVLADDGKTTVTADDALQKKGWVADEEMQPVVVPGAPPPSLAPRRNLDDLENLLEREQASRPVAVPSTTTRTAGDEPHMDSEAVPVVPDAHSSSVNSSSWVPSHADGATLMTYRKDEIPIEVDTSETAAWEMPAVMTRPNVFTHTIAPQPLPDMPVPASHAPVKTTSFDHPVPRFTPPLDVHLANVSTRPPTANSGDAGDFADTPTVASISARGAANRSADDSLSVSPPLTRRAPALDDEVARPEPRNSTAPPPSIPGEYASQPVSPPGLSTTTDAQFSMTEVVLPSAAFQLPAADTGEPTTRPNRDPVGVAPLATAPVLVASPKQTPIRDEPVLLEPEAPTKDRVTSAVPGVSGAEAADQFDDLASASPTVAEANGKKPKKVKKVKKTKGGSTAPEEQEADSGLVIGDPTDNGDDGAPQPAEQDTATAYVEPTPDANPAVAEASPDANGSARKDSMRQRKSKPLAPSARHFDPGAPAE